MCFKLITMKMLLYWSTLCIGPFHFLSDPTQICHVDQRSGLKITELGLEITELGHNFTLFAILNLCHDAVPYHRLLYWK